MSRIEEYRDELRLFAYRMSGSLLEADRLTEDILRRARQGPGPGAAGGAWPLYRMAVEACVESLVEKAPRTLPALALQPSDPVALNREPVHFGWLEPFPDDLYPDNGAIVEDAPGFLTESLFSTRESISLYFIEALQRIEPVRRAALLLSDVLGWDVVEVAAAMVTSPAKTIGLLEDARGDMDGFYLRDLGRREPPSDESATAVFMRYLYSWETTSVGSLAGQLSGGVTLQVVPGAAWYGGRDAVLAHLEVDRLGEGAEGRWRLLPRRANGQLAFGVYRRDVTTGLYIAHSIQVLHFESDLVSEIISFEYPSLFPFFDLLPQLSPQG